MKLYYSPAACSLAPHIALHEAGISVDLVKTDVKEKKTADGGDFWAVNSKGYVPTLQLDNGQVLTEDTEEIADRQENGIDILSYKEIIEAIRQLSPAYRTVFNLFIIEGLSHEQ